MLSLERSLTDRLRKERVRIEAPDANTACFRGVPANPDYFSKPATNLLVKRPDPRLPFVVCVDDDLRYHGDNEEVARAFAKGRREQGWRVLFVGGVGEHDLQPVVERALEALGFDGREPALGPARAGPGRKGLLASFGEDLAAAARSDALEPCVGREALIDAICRCLSLERSRLPVIAGVPGVGKTNLLHGVAARLCAQRPGVRFIRVDMAVLSAGTMFGAEREQLVATLLEEAAAATDTIVALERLEFAHANAPHTGPLLDCALDRGARLVGTVCAAPRPSASSLPLRRRIQVVELQELPLAAGRKALEAHRSRIELHHGVAIHDGLLEAAIDAGCAMDGLFPAKAIDLLDRAAAAAALAGRAELAVGDLHAEAAVADLVQQPRRPEQGVG